MLRNLVTRRCTVAVIGYIEAVNSAAVVVVVIVERLTIYYQANLSVADTHDHPNFTVPRCATRCQSVSTGLLLYRFTALTERRRSHLNSSREQKIIYALSNKNTLPTSTPLSGVQLLVGYLKYLNSTLDSLKPPRKGGMQPAAMLRQ